MIIIINVNDIDSYYHLLSLQLPAIKKPPTDRSMEGFFIAGCMVAGL